MGTLTTTAKQDARLSAAFGRRLGLGRKATGPETKAAIFDLLRAYVEGQEHDAEVDAAVAAAVNSKEPFDAP